MLGFVSLVWAAVVLGLFFTNRLSPPLVMFVDVPLAVAYILSVATVAANWSYAIGHSCFASKGLVYSDCATLKGVFGILIIQMLTFHGAIIWDAIVMSQNPNRRRDVRAVAQNAVPGMAKPAVAAAGGGNLGQFQLDGTPIYPAELASPAAQYNFYMLVPQQGVMMHQNQDPEQQQHQQYQQNRGPPQELSGAS